MTLISENWGELLEPTLRKVYFDHYNQLAQESRIPTLFNVGSSSKAAEHDLGVGAFSAWGEYKGTIEYDDNSKGFETIYTHKQFARGVSAERKLIDDDMYGVIQRRTEGLAYGAYLKREQDGASMYNNAFSSAVTGADGVELCGAHPASPSNPTTQSNAGSTALSYDAVVATQLLMRGFKNDRGDLAPSHGNLLVVPPALQEEAWTITDTIGKPGTANHDGNYVQSQGMSTVVWDYLTDTNNWFLIDSRLLKMYVNWFDRVPMEFENDKTGDYNLINNYRGYMRYSFGWSDWRWVYGHEVA